MKQNDEIKKELEDLAPGLSAMQKHKPFTTPDGYFRDFSDRALERIRKETSETSGLPERRIQSSQWTWILLIFSPKRAFGAAIVLLVAFVGYLWMSRGGQDPSNQWADLSIEELNEYVLANAEDFEREDVVDFVNPESNQIFYNESESTYESLEDYLEYEVDEDFIEEELM